MEFESPKLNALVTTLVVVVFIALCGVLMWFLSDLTPLSEENNSSPTTPYAVTGNSAEAIGFLPTEIKEALSVPSNVADYLLGLLHLND